MTELHDLICQNDYDKLEEEIKKGGKYDVNARDEEWGYRHGLHWAAHKGTHLMQLIVFNIVIKTRSSTAVFCDESCLKFGKLGKMEKREPVFVMYDLKFFKK